MKVGMFIVARFVTGLGSGAIVTLVPIWQSEVAPPKTRGFLVGMHGEIERNTKCVRDLLIYLQEPLFFLGTRLLLGLELGFLICQHQLFVCRSPSNLPVLTLTREQILLPFNSLLRNANSV